MPLSPPPGAPGSGATPIQVSSPNAANASATATLPAVTGVTAYITGFQITAAGATTGLPVVVTVTGLLGGTINHIFTFAVGPTVGSSPLTISYPQPLPATGPSIAIVVTLPASGAGGTNATVAAQGFYL